MRLKNWALLAMAGGFLLSGAASAHTAATTVDYGTIHGYMEISNARVTAVGSGVFLNNVAAVDSGSSVTLSADWTIVTTDGNGGGYCPGCVMEQYVAWISPATASGANPTNLGLWLGQDGFSPNGVSASGHFDWTTTAPTVAGTYFVGGAGSLDFFFLPGLEGTVGFLGSTPDLVSFEVVVVPAPIPEPETYAMFMAGLGLMGFIARRRKNSPA